MNRRDFLKRLGFAAGAVALSPLLDLAPIVDAPSAAIVCELTFGCIPVRTSAYVPLDTIYFIAHDGVIRGVINGVAR